MENYLKIYWLTRLDGIQSLFYGLALLCALACVFIIMGTIIASDFDEFKSDPEKKIRADNRKKIKSKMKWIIPLGIICTLIRVFLPSKNDAIMIIAGGKTLNYIQSDTSLSKLPYQTTAFISKYLDKEIKEIKNK